MEAHEGKVNETSNKWLEIENIKKHFVRTHWDRNKRTVLGALAKLRKATISFAMSVRPSVRMDTTWILLDRFS
jgi:hypothetical protein